MRTAIRLIVSLGVATAVLLREPAASAATAIEYGLIAAR
jgi:hypothetical protein